MLVAKPWASKTILPNPTHARSVPARNSTGMSNATGTDSSGRIDAAPLWAPTSVAPRNIDPATRRANPGTRHSSVKAAPMQMSTIPMPSGMMGATSGPSWSNPRMGCEGSTSCVGPVIRPPKVIRGNGVSCFHSCGTRDEGSISNGPAPSPIHWVISAPAGI